LYLANIFNWHAPFLFLGSLSLALSLSLHFLLPSMQGHMAHGKIAALSTLKGIYNSPNQQKALLFIAMMTAGHFMIIPFLSPSLVLNAGLTEAQLPLIYLVGGGVSMITGPLIGRMADRYGKHVVFQIAGVLVLIPVVLLTSLGPTPLFYILLIVAFFFILSGGRFIPANAMVSSTVEAKNRGSFMSLVSSTQNLSSAIASSLAGAIVFTNSEQKLINYQYVGYFAVFFGLIAVLLSRRILSLESNPSEELKKKLL
jgi:predicted MFS family arabinose efflux permease